MRRMTACMVGLCTLLVVGCQGTTSPDATTSATSGSAYFDGGGTLGSGYGAARADSTASATASADTTGRIGGTLGSGY